MSRRGRFEACCSCFAPFLPRQVLFIGASVGKKASFAPPRCQAPCSSCSVVVVRPRKSQGLSRMPGIRSAPCASALLRRIERPEVSIGTDDRLIGVRRPAQAVFERSVPRAVVALVAVFFPYVWHSSDRSIFLRHARVGQGSSD